MSSTRGRCSGSPRLAGPPGAGASIRLVTALIGAPVGVLVVVLVGLLVVSMGPLAGRALAADGWTWPVTPPEVVHPFDPPANPYGSGHRGVDLAAAPGQPVLAAGAGEVTFAGMLAGRGVVVVSHGAIRTTYEPVDAAVSVGEGVAMGHRLGSLQAFAHHCAAACLHWGAIRGETYLDPLGLVRAGLSRLLPYLDDGLVARTRADGAPAEAGSSVAADSPAPGEPLGPGPLTPESVWRARDAPTGSATGTEDGPVGRAAREGREHGGSVDADRAEAAAGLVVVAGGTLGVVIIRRARRRWDPR